MTSDRSAPDRPFSADEYPYRTADAGHTEAYLWPVVMKQISFHSQGNHVFDLGCGNGAFMRHLSSAGYDLVGVDPSESGVTVSRDAYPECKVHVGSTHDDLASQFGQFDVVVSLEVVEHVYDPRKFAETISELLKPGGTAIISTPFHGYWKNLSLALTGKMDAHFTALWDHGHIKFWSPKTISILLQDAGFQKVSFDYAGRWYPFSKSMIAIAEKPL